MPVTLQSVQKQLDERKAQIAVHAISLAAAALAIEEELTKVDPSEDPSKHKGLAEKRAEFARIDRQHTSSLEHVRHLELVQSALTSKTQAASKSKAH